MRSRSITEKRMDLQFSFLVSEVLGKFQKKYEFNSDLLCRLVPGSETRGFNPADDGVSAGLPDLFKAWRNAGKSAELPNLLEEKGLKSI